MTKKKKLSPFQLNLHDLTTLNAMCSDYDITLSMDFENQFSFLPSLHSLISLLQVENANTLSMKCSDVYLYESSLQPDQFGSLPKLQVRPKSLPWR